MSPIQPSPRNGLENLPSDLLAAIGQRLDWTDQVSVRAVSKTLRASVQDEALVNFRSAIAADILDAGFSGRRTSVMRTLWRAEASGVNADNLPEKQHVLAFMHDLQLVHQSALLKKLDPPEIRTLAAVIDKVARELTHGPQAARNAQRALRVMHAKDVLSISFKRYGTYALAGVSLATSALSRMDKASDLGVATGLSTCGLLAASANVATQCARILAPVGLRAPALRSPQRPSLDEHAAFYRVCAALWARAEEEAKSDLQRDPNDVDAGMRRQKAERSKDLCERDADVLVARMRQG